MHALRAVRAFRSFARRAVVAAMCVAVAHLPALPARGAAAGTGASAAADKATAAHGYVRGNTGAENCRVEDENHEMAEARWPQARDLCASKGGGLPIIRTPRENRALRALLNASGAAGAWIGLDDISGIPVALLGGGWQWADARTWAGALLWAQTTTATRARSPPTTSPTTRASTPGPPGSRPV